MFEINNHQMRLSSSSFMITYSTLQTQINLELKAAWSLLHTLGFYETRTY